MAEENIKSILDKMKQVIETNDIRQPSWWLDEAQKLAVLRQDLQNQLVKAEIKYRNEILRLTEQDIPYNRAENMVKGRELVGKEKMTVYEWYNYLRTRDDVVTDIISIAKKRADSKLYGGF